MFTFHYLICKTPKKKREREVTNSMKFQVKKLVFNDNKLETSDEYFVSREKLDKLVNDLDYKDYTEIDDDKIDLDSFLKNIKLSKL